MTQDQNSWHDAYWPCDGDRILCLYDLPCEFAPHDKEAFRVTYKMEDILMHR